ncbi:MAG: histidine ammonia-lyase, partial [Bacteroidota bacterium]|nr:histidine ammonia-lyase [Bacteroidota bacterium]
AIDFHAPLKCGKGTAAAYETLRKHIQHLQRDRVLHTDIQKALELVRSEELLRNVQKAVGGLA